MIWWSAGKTASLFSFFSIKYIIFQRQIFILIYYEFQVIALVYVLIIPLNQKLSSKSSGCFFRVNKGGPEVASSVSSCESGKQMTLSPHDYTVKSLACVKLMWLIETSATCIADMLLPVNEADIGQ